MEKNNFGSNLRIEHFIYSDLCSLVLNEETLSLADSLDRTFIGFLFWIEQASMSIIIIYWWQYGNAEVPHDFKIPVFMPLVTAMFVLGYLLEWKYHVSYPLAETKPGYRVKKKILNGLIFVFVLLIVISAVGLSYVHSEDDQLSAVFPIFVGILGSSFLVLHCMAVAQGINRLFKCCAKGKTQEGQELMHHETKILVTIEEDHPLDR